MKWSFLLLAALLQLSPQAWAVEERSRCELAASDTRAYEFALQLDRLEQQIGNPKASVFGTTSMIGRVFSERVILFGAARMGIMQIADPKVSEVMLSSSKFREQPVMRMQNTIAFLKTLIYGDWTSVRKMSNAIFQIHHRLQGEHHLSDDEFDDLTLWVHATTWDSVLIAYEKLVRKLTPEEQRQFYVETKKFGILLGLPPEKIPKTYLEFRAYVDAKTLELKLSVQTKEYIQALLENNDVLQELLPENWPISLDRTRKVVVAGATALLPLDIQEQMGAKVDPYAAAMLNIGFSVSPYVLRCVPSRYRYSRAFLEAGGKPGCPFH